MPHYLLSVHIDADDSRAARSDEEQQALAARIAELEDEMRAAGALLSQGALMPSAGAKVVDATTGPAVVIDGPFAESKEHLGGFYIVEAADESAALEWAAKTSACIERAIEVRAFFDRRDG